MIMAMVMPGVSLIARGGARPNCDNDLHAFPSVFPPLSPRYALTLEAAPYSLAGKRLLRKVSSPASRAVSHLRLCSESFEQPGKRKDVFKHTNSCEADPLAVCPRTGLDRCNLEIGIHVRSLPGRCLHLARPARWHKDECTRPESFQGVPGDLSPRSGALRAAVVLQSFRHPYLLCQCSTELRWSKHTFVHALAHGQMAQENTSVPCAPLLYFAMMDKESISHRTSQQLIKKQGMAAFGYVAAAMSAQ